MSQYGNVKIENGVITTPNGQITLKPDSTVRVATVPFNQYAKKAVGAGLLAAGIFTGGGVWLIVPGVGLLFHDSYEVRVTTGGQEFFVERFKSVVGDAREVASMLHERISEEIEKVRVERPT